MLFDYEYFDARERAEDAAARDGSAYELDEEVRGSYGHVFERYWNAFDAVVRWHQDFVRFAEDVAEGTYVSETWEKILSDEDGRQYVCEAIAMFGVILKILDAKFDWRVSRAHGGGVLSHERGERGHRERGRNRDALRADGIRRRAENATGGVPGAIFREIRNARVA